MTAAHVTEAGTEELRALFVTASGEWSSHEINLVSTHSSEDVCLFRLQGDEKSSASPIVPAGTWEGASCSFMGWGYPRDVVVEGNVRPRPDLLYLEGYVRRRISDLELEKIRGKHFFELSEPGGSGCSGAPVVKRPSTTGEWHLIGVYLGERESDGVHVGYASREDSFRAWLLTFYPERLGSD